MESVQTGCPILRENDRADVLYMLVVGKVRLFFEMPGTSSELGVPGSNSNQAGLSAGRQWSNLTISALAPALEDCQLLAFNGLMEYGFIFGHGAYLGPELHRRLPPIAPRRNPSPSSDNDFFMAKALKIKTDSKWWPVNEGTNKQSKSPSKVR
jgi:hypothetical protein